MIVDNIVPAVHLGSSLNNVSRCCGRDIIALQGFHVNKACRSAHSSHCRGVVCGTALASQALAGRQSELQSQHWSIYCSCAPFGKMQTGTTFVVYASICRQVYAHVSIYIYIYIYIHIHTYTYCLYVCICLCTM